jgi:hypothetical protein
MALWDSVQKTDPSHTKKVNQRGGFTSISAHYQVMRATEVFGPVGTGWGYECGEPIFHGAFVIVPVRVWYRDRANTFGPIYGSAEMMGNRPDSDAPKKAMTDALTKALSHLGFNADVFLGKFDDNKYVAQVTEEFASKGSEADQIKADDFKAAIEGATDETELARVAKELSGSGLPPGLLTNLRALYSAKKRTIAA